ncbi:MAG: arginine--tRNA ligase [Candidatus Pacebacteria bacterium]|nr:arginine--tRNA ligase [Candidatus Paceibacterota bacterium]
MIEEKLINLVRSALTELGIEAEDIKLEHPADLFHGDFSCNAAMVLAKEARKSPRELAEEIVRYIEENKPSEVEKVAVAGPGFINFDLSREFFIQNVRDVLEAASVWGRNDALKGKKVMVEYTDPNPFKVFHIGHLMSNAIGESVSRLIEFSGAEVKRANYQGDVGLHVAKAIWGLKEIDAPIESVEMLGKAYAAGAVAYESNPVAEKEINEINREVYERSNEEVNVLYDTGRTLSLEHFEEIYKKLGTKFDHYFFESETGPLGKEIVEEYLSSDASAKDSVFRESDGAVIFDAETHDPSLHTRVFLNSEGLPTYEAKELGLLKKKNETYPFDISITITAEEQREYFRVVKEAMKQIFGELAEKVAHLTHGTLRLTSGKMSSRTGDVISGESLVNDVEVEVEKRMGAFNVEGVRETAESVAVAAIKYSILKQSTGRDIIFNPEQALSFEGDSGPYLQYTNARIGSLLEKARESGVEVGISTPLPQATDVERLLYRFPEVVRRATENYEPHYITNYLTELAGVFNSWYGQEKILDGTPEVSYRLAIAHAVSTTLQNGLWLLGIKAPERM